MFDVLYSKQAFLDYENIAFINAQKFAVYQRGLSMNLVKKLKVFHLLCLLKRDREKVFADVLNTKAIKT